MDNIRYSARYGDTHGNYICIAHFNKDVPEDLLKDFIDRFWELYSDEDIIWADMFDMDEGRVIYQRDSWADEQYYNESYPNDCDNDMGFDPYLGCYTDDC